MTISTTIQSKLVLGNGATTIFDLNFPIIAAEHLECTLLRSDGSSQDLTLNVDFSVTNAGLGNLASVTYPVSGSPLPTGDSLNIERNTPASQLLDLVKGRAFNSELIEDTLDTLTLVIQDFPTRFAVDQSEISQLVTQAQNAVIAAAAEASEAEAAKVLAEAAQAAAEQAATNALAGLIVFQGVWGAGTQYNQFDLVTYQGQTYHCDVDHTANADFTVDLAAMRWRLFAFSDFNRNLNVPSLTTGGASAYAITLPDPPPILFDGLAALARFHLENTANPTLAIDGSAPMPIMIRDETNVLNAVTPGLIGEFESLNFVLVTEASDLVVEILTTPAREFVAGDLLPPLQSQNGDFDLWVEGGNFDALAISNAWENGPLGVASANYSALNPVVEVRSRSNFVQQTVYLDMTDYVATWRRVGRGTPLVWDDWINETPFGVGMDWTDRGGVRAGGTWYVNDTGRVRGIKINTNVGAISFAIGATEGTAIVHDFNDGDAEFGNLTTWVPAGHTYRLVAGTHRQWLEYD